MKKTFEKSGILVTYFLASTATFVLNKFIMSYLDFKMHYMLIVAQSVIITGFVGLQTLFFNVKISFSHIEKWYISSLLLTIMMFTNMKAIFYMPLSIFTLYKNCSVILTAILEYKVFDRKISIIGYISFMLMIVSSLVGNTLDKIQTMGYIWMALNILATSGYAIYLKKIMVIDLSSRTESVFFTSLFSIPILVVMSLVFDPFTEIIITYKLSLFIFLSSLCAYLTAFSTAWSMKRLSSTTYSMAGALNKLFLSASGFIIFEELYDPKKLISLLIGICSASIYSIDSIKSVPISQQ